MKTGLTQWNAKKENQPEPTQKDLEVGQQLEEEVVGDAAGHDHRVLVSPRHDALPVAVDLAKPLRFPDKKNNHTFQDLENRL